MLKYWQKFCLILLDPRASRGIHDNRGVRIVIDHKTLRALAGATVAAIGLAASQSAVAIATVTLSSAGPLYYDLNSGTPQLTVDFRVQLGANDTVADIMTYAGVFVAYNPAVLKYNNMSFGSAMTSSVAATTQFIDGNYTDPFDDASYSINPASVAGLTLGTPVDKTTYWDGSLYPILTVGTGFNGAGDVGGANTLLALQKAAGGALLYSIIFDVVTTNIATSSIVLLDDLDYLPDTLRASFDYKHGLGNESYYVASNTLEVYVPAPAPLALMAAGLVGLGMRRRARA